MFFDQGKKVTRDGNILTAQKRRKPAIYRGLTLVIYVVMFMSDFEIRSLLQESGHHLLPGIKFQRDPFLGRVTKKSNLLSSY